MILVSTCVYPIDYGSFPYSASPCFYGLSSLAPTMPIVYRQRYYIQHQEAGHETSNSVHPYNAYPFFQHSPLSNFRTPLPTPSLLQQSALLSTNAPQKKCLHHRHTKKIQTTRHSNNKPAQSASTQTPPQHSTVSAPQDTYTIIPQSIYDHALSSFEDAPHTKKIKLEEPLPENTPNTTPIPDAVYTNILDCCPLDALRSRALFKKWFKEFQQSIMESMVGPEKAFQIMFEKGLPFLTEHFKDFPFLQDPSYYEAPTTLSDEVEYLRPYWKPIALLSVLGNAHVKVAKQSPNCPPEVSNLQGALTLSCSTFGLKFLATHALSALHHTKKHTGQDVRFHFCNKGIFSMAAWAAVLDAGAILLPMPNDFMGCELWSAHAGSFRTPTNIFHHDMIHLERIWRAQYFGAACLKEQGDTSFLQQRAHCLLDWIYSTLPEQPNDQPSLQTIRNVMRKFAAFLHTTHEASMCIPHCTESQTSLTDDRDFTALLGHFACSKAGRYSFCQDTLKTIPTPEFHSLSFLSQKVRQEWLFSANQCIEFTSTEVCEIWKKIIQFFDEPNFFKTNGAFQHYDQNIFCILSDQPIFALESSFDDTIFLIPSKKALLNMSVYDFVLFKHCMQTIPFITTIRDAYTFLEDNLREAQKSLPILNTPPFLLLRCTAELKNFQTALRQTMQQHSLNPYHLEQQ